MMGVSWTTRFLILGLALLEVTVARAGVVELSAGGNYRRSNIDVDSFDESTSVTASISYFLGEMSAIELSYTDGKNRRIIGEGSTSERRSLMSFKTSGLDFVYTFGGRESAFSPYVKLGALYILEKKITDQFRDSSGWYDPSEAEEDRGVVPSAGVGLKLGLTQSVSLKFGVDAWASSPIGAKDRVTGETKVIKTDMAARASLSFAWAL